MPVPKTFSAPGEEFTPAYEDALIYAGWLAHIDDVPMARFYSSDRRNLAAGVRIYRTWRNADIRDGYIQVKQAIVQHYFPDTAYALATAQAGVAKIILGIEHLFPYDPKYSATDVDTQEVTANRVAQRSVMILNTGTLYQEEMETGDGKLVNPYATPRLESGLYDPERIVYLNSKPPKIQRRTTRYSRREIKKDEDAFGLANNEWMVGYGVFAEYDIEIANFEAMNAGGSLG